ncbi:MAG TPA: hypothetical protein VF604_13885 [Pyrinomonadaceae bacterium]|jgi:hypothetical protein
MKTFKLLGIILSIFCAACGSNSSSSSSSSSSASDSSTATNGSGYVTKPSTDTTTNTTASTVSNVATAESGLDLQAVAELAKKAKNAEDFERLLNQPDGVNNLDLDEDGKVDYISVAEFKDGTKNAKGYSLAVDLGEENIQEIATIQLERDNPGDKTIDVYVAGNQEIYGADDNYAGSWDYSDSSFAAWSFGSRPYYSSTYRRGYYPSYYSAFAVVGLSGYRTKMQSYRAASPFKAVASVLTKAKLTSPNAGKVAANIKAPLSKPTVAQQSFQKTNPSRAVATRSATSPTSGSSSTRSTTSPSYSSSRSLSSPSSSSSSRPSSSRSTSSSSRRK